MTKKERIAYIAGIIDGEAYVGIKKSTYGMRKRPDVKSPIYSERVQIRMACRPILELIKTEFGGALGTEPRVYQSASGFKSRKIMSIYRASHKVAYNLIKATRKHLIEKSVQADCIITLRQNKNSKAARMRAGPKQKRTHSKAVLDERERLYQICKDCHKWFIRQGYAFRNIALDYLVNFHVNLQFSRLSGLARQKFTSETANW